MQAVYDELKEKLVGQRLGRVYQLSLTDCVMDFHLADGTWLFISCRPGDPHIYLTNRSIKSLEGQGNVSPQFAMVLRKHLGGAALVALRKPSTERTIEFEFSNYDSSGEIKALFLIADLMGRSANLYLLNAERRIIDKLKYRKDESLGLVVGVEYCGPAARNAIDDLSDSDLEFLLSENDISTSGLKDKLPGFGPLLVEELVCRVSTMPPITATKEMVKDVWHNQSQPAVYSENPISTVAAKPELKSRTVLSSIELKCKSEWEVKKFSTISKAAQWYYDHEREAAELAVEIAGVRAKLKARLDKSIKLSRNLRSDLAAQGNEQEYKRYGDLLLANLATLERTGDAVRVTDLYDPEQQLIDIPLDENLTPQAGAERYFKQYQKARRGRQEIEKRLNIVDREIEKLRDLSAQLDRVSTTENLSHISDILNPASRKLKRRPKKDSDSRTRTISGVRRSHWQTSWPS